MIKAEDIRIGIVGLGYVGLPLSLLFAKRYPTVGYDCNGRRVAELLQADDTTKETDAAQLQQALRDGRLCRPPHDTAHGRRAAEASAPESARLAKRS